MTILIVLFTILLILDCLLLGLLVMVQLPKKEAGIGMAFGGGAADALFGAGSGNALSQLTKYSAIAFFVLVFVLSVLNNRSRGANTSEFSKQYEKTHGVQAPSSAAPAPANNTAPTATPAMPLMINSNAVAPTAPATAPASTNKAK